MLGLIEDIVLRSGLYFCGLLSSNLSSLQNYGRAMKVSLGWDCWFPTTWECVELRGCAARPTEAFWSGDAHLFERLTASSAGKEGERRFLVVLKV